MTFYYFVLFMFVYLQGVNGRTPYIDDVYEQSKYNTFNEIELRLKNVMARSPEFARLDSIGRTYEQNDIWRITFSEAFSVAKPTIWIDCGMQSRDWITHSTCMYIVDTIHNHLMRTEVNYDIGNLLDRFDLAILPVVNPDGYINSWTPYSRSWTKNMNPGKLCDGVFLSQNFPFKWGSYYSGYTECEDDYIGTGPESEEETKAIIQSLKQLQDSNGVFAVFHMESYGQMWTYPWSYTTVSSPVSQALEELCQTAVLAIKKINSNNYRCGQTANMDKTRGGTFVDYAHTELGILTVYSIALRTGDSDAPYEVPEEEIPETGMEILEGILAVLVEESFALDCIHDFSYEKYNSIDEIEKHLKCISSTLKDLTDLESIGETFEGNDILKMTFSKDFAAEREIIWIDCGMQGRDWLTHSTCMYIIDIVADHFVNKKDPMVEELLNNYDLVVIPVVNPDGYARSWTSNNRHWTKNTNEDGGICDGVFISQNFPFMFGFPYSNRNECDLDYIGPNSMSELETVALESILNTLQSRIFVAFHLESSGKKWMYPWSYSENPSQYAECLERNCEAGINAIFEETGVQYICDQLAVGEDTTRGGTFVDYLHKDLQISLVYLLALRSGKEYAYDVPVDEISDTTRETWQGILAAVEKATVDPCLVEFTMKPAPTTPGPPNE